MSLENNPITVLALERAWRQKDVRACYESLAVLPDGVVFRMGHILLEMSPAIDEEKEMMQRSMGEGREFCLIKTDSSKTIIEGGGGEVDMDEIAGALYKVAASDKPAIFSHTHWDVKKHPLPGYSDVGLGDIPIFNFFRDQFPLLACRVVFNSRSTVRALVYKGSTEQI